ncbi:MAG: sigma-70 family RNA polymerase sigma factor [Cyanobacteria bacterium SZAS TMP-1]|nr:sigma-70 family RNA polymerase sigma factor [Cyanobacteria bacterium SZAS TMP-1]
MNSRSKFEDLTFCYMEQLFRLAYARVGNFDDAEDILQDTYVKAYRAFDTLRDRTQVKRWLTQILINTIHDHGRKSRRALQTVDISEMPESFMEEPRKPGPEDEICHDEIDPALMKALNSMPKAFLIPLLLREIDEASYEEIAQALDIPIGTVMSRLSRARSFLRRSLLQESDDREQKGSTK